MSLIANVRSLPPSAWILFAGTFINRFGSFVLAFLVLYLTRIGYSVSQAGLAVGAYGAGHFVAAGVGGWLADHIGRRHTIALSMFSSAAAMLALSQARGLPLILTFSLVAGFTTELYRPASSALVIDMVPQGKRVTAFALYRFAVNLGFAAGPATAGFLAERSFFYLFLGDALTSCVFGAVALLALPHGTRVAREAGERTGWGEALTTALADRRFVRFLLASLCITIIDFQITSTFALHVRDAGFSSSTFGLLISLNGVLIVIFELGLTAWTEGLPHRRTIAAGFVLAGLGFALTAVAHTVPLLAMTVVIWTFGEMISSPVAAAYVADLSPERLRGRYMGLWGGMWSLGLMLGPPLGTLVYAQSPPVLWGLCGVLGITGALLVGWEKGDGSTGVTSSQLP